jgi:hypothetical protein
MSPVDPGLPLQKINSFPKSRSIQCSVYIINARSQLPDGPLAFADRKQRVNVLAHARLGSNWSATLFEIFETRVFPGVARSEAKMKACRRVSIAKSCHIKRSRKASGKSAFRTIRAGSRKTMQTDHG